MSSTMNGVITVKDGKVASLRNITDLNGARVVNDDLHSVLLMLSNTGWKLKGDYEIVISKDG